MKWSFIIREKLKASALLGGIMLAIILATFVSRSNMDGIDKSFSSIYQDRLIPATTIVYLTENLYTKRLLLEKFVLSEQINEKSEVGRQLDKHNQILDSLITAFGKTYLVDRELLSLIGLKNSIANYASMEKEILKCYDAHNPQKGRIMFEGEGVAAFQLAVVHLNRLAKIQSDVGSELMQESKTDFAGFALISFLQIALAMVVGLIILIWIKNYQIIERSGLPKTDSQNFNLN